MFIIHLGIPEMKSLWDTLTSITKDGSASRKEETLYRQLGKAME